MDRISDRLFLGNYQDAQRKRELQENRIDVAVNLSQRPSPKIECIDFLHVPLDDGPANSQSAFNAAYNTVREQLQDGVTVLVFCNEGVSRSVAVVSAVLTAEKDIELRDAINQVEKKRPVANPSPTLVRQAQHALDAT